MALLKRKRQKSLTGQDNGILPAEEDQSKTENAPTSTEPETSEVKEVTDEYEKDSSDEEDVINTIGNVPLEWYDEYDHIGYNVAGKKIAKSKKGRDEIDEFLEKNDNPNYWRTVRDSHTGEDRVLNDEDVELIKNIVDGRYTEKDVDAYEPSVDFFTFEKMVHPVTNHPEHKRSFIPSLAERRKVGKMVDAIKSGRMKMSEPEKEEDSDEELEEKLPSFYQLWTNDDESSTRHRQYIPAPKSRLPGHAESYNPPPEYLFDEKEKKDWEDKEPSERRLPIVPKKHSSLREVCAYPEYVQMILKRCFDLYLLPRQVKMRANIRAEDLLPKLPNPRDLQPFPTTQHLVFEGHTDSVLCVSLDPSGCRLASGSADNTLRIWKTDDGRCVSVIKFSHAVKSVAWNPNSDRPCIAAAVNNQVVIIKANAPFEAESRVLSSSEADASVMTLPVEWSLVQSGPEYDDGIRLKITHPKTVDKVVWHKKGDYFAVVMKESQTMPVFIHMLSKRKSLNPLKKPKDPVQTVMFHPSKPYFFVATQRFVKQYDLMKQTFMKKLQTNCKWISSMDIHPGGDNVITGSYDKRLCWFDLDLDTKPYKMLKHHQKAIRKVSCHKSYPLFASASDDGTIIVCHGMVYDDLGQNALIVPLKVLKGHKTNNGLGVLDCEFHPKQPWIFSAGADCTIRCFTN